MSLEEWGCNKSKHGGITPPNISTALDFLKNVCWNDTWLSMCHHQSFLVDDCTTKQLEIDKKWIFSIFLRVWPWNDLDVTLTWPWCYPPVKHNSFSCYFLLIISCWCLLTNLTLQTIFWFFSMQVGCKCVQEFSIDPLPAGAAYIRVFIFY